jgi:hypothetical protein
MSSEERRHKRRAFECAALLDFRDGTKPLACRVVDISDGGARIIVGSCTEAIPDDVILWLHGKVRRPCRTAWRRGAQIGVQFLKF